MRTSLVVLDVLLLSSYCWESCWEGEKEREEDEKAAFTRFREM